MTETIYLVSCVSQKLDHPAEARDLYTSALFLKAKAYVTATGCDWFVFSAKYGLVLPTQVIEPYEQTLNIMAGADRRQWAALVLTQLAEAAPHAKRIVFLAGNRYRENLIPTLERQGVAIECPMANLRIGEQLQWLGSRTWANNR